MQFTKAEEYGVFGVLYLADKDRTTITPLSEISEAQGIPEKFLAKIFQSLSKAGLVRSHRGVRGGFALSRDPNEISIKEILETIQGPYHLMRCVADPESCDSRQKTVGFCPLRELVVSAEEQLVSVFERHTLADLLQWQTDQISRVR